MSVWTPKIIHVRDKPLTAEELNSFRDKTHANSGKYILADPRVFGLGTEIAEELKRAAEWFCKIQQEEKK
jgi:hypothetical protein